MKEEGREERVRRGASAGSAGGVRAQAPLAVREPVEHVIHGDRRVDHYAWMREKSDPRVKEHLEAENAYADAFMQPTEAFQEKLYQEMLGRIQQTDLSVPYLLRGYWYYTRTEEGKQYPIYCRKRANGGRREQLANGEWRVTSEESRQLTVDSPWLQRREGPPLKTEGGPPSADSPVGMDAGNGEEDIPPAEVTRSSDSEELGSSTGMPDQGKGEEEVLLDLNELAVGHTFMALGIFEVSDDSQRLAYATDTTGFRQYVLEVKRLGAAADGGQGRESTANRTRLQRREDPPLDAQGGVPGDMLDGEESALPSEPTKRPREERQELAFRVERVTSAAWAADNRTLFYVTEDEVTKRSNQLWRHEFEEVASGRRPLASEASRTLTVDSAQLQKRLYNDRDELIYEEKDERFRIDVERSRSGAYLFLEINSHTASEIRYLPANTPRQEFQLVAPRQDEHEYYVDHHPGSARNPAGGVFFIRTNSAGRTYRLMAAPTAEPGREHWREVIANRPAVMLSALAAFRTHLVLSEREDGLPYLRVVDLTREAASALAGSQRIAFAEPTYSAVIGMNPEFETGHVRYMYESLVTPRSVYDYDVRTGERILKKQQPVLGDFDTKNYVSERLHAKANDGTLIPVSVVRRRDTVRDGSAPLLLHGYGSYGLSLPPAFSSNRLSLLNRGMVYAIAHVRGGGELGKPWHDHGRMHRKMNTFTDFIACAEHLIAQRYTSEGRLVMEGGSAGGLLLGAVTNMRPELFKVVVSHVPFVDVLNTMLDPTLPLTVGEYEEWGNPQVADDYFYMKQYCPYTNIERKVYPRTLLKTAWNDSQVMYWEAAKYVAKLRAMKTDSNVLLLKTNMRAGHGGASGRYDYLREIALDYAFLLGELEIRE